MTIKEYNQAVETYADGLYRFALKMVSDHEKSRDIVQDCYEKLWLHHSEVEAEKVKSYLFSSIHHRSIDLHRKEKHRQEFSQQEILEPYTFIDYSDVQEILHQALEHLPEIQRSVVLLRDYEGYSYREIGELTGISESQVKVYIYRARVFLKSYIGQIQNVM